MSAVLGGDYALSRWEMLKAQWRVIHALMLHDIRSRMGGNASGFLIIGIGWPLANIGILLLINSSLGRAVPYGESAALWYATGLLPFMCFQYMSRFLSLGLILNKPLLSFPIVKASDILLARALTEVLNAGLVTLILCSTFWAYNISFVPMDPVQALLALISMMLLGLGFGIVNGVIAAVFPFWATGYALIQILLWLSSGVLFVPDSLPESIRTPLSYLPQLQGVEWMRSAFYDGYGSSILNKPYLLSVALGAIFLGVAMERLMRGKILQ